MDNRRLLPVVVLIVSVILFGGAIIFALQPSGTKPANTATPLRVGAASTLVPTATAASASDAPATAAPEPSPTATAAASAVAVATRTVAAPAVASRTASAVPTPTAAAVAANPPASSRPAAPTAPVPVVPSAAPVVPPTATPVPAPAVAPTATPAPPPPAVPTPTPTKPPAAPPAAPIAGPPPQNVGVPVRLRVPSLGIDAAIEQVGLDRDGNMATPEDPWNTGWYSPGTRPGRAGNAAIAGHVDYHGIGPVIFWDLRNIAMGAEVFVTTDSGQTLRFVARASEYYRPENAPLQEIFGATNAVNLNLITCGGTFDPQTRSYDQRFVVFTTYAGQ